MAEVAAAGEVAAAAAAAATEENAKVLDREIACQACSA
jgi:hypothetical protein